MASDATDRSSIVHRPRRVQQVPTPVSADGKVLVANLESDGEYTLDWQSLGTSSDSADIDFDATGLNLTSADNVQEAVADVVTALDVVGAITPLTDSTGQTPDNTIANVPDATAAVTDTSAASLTSVNTSLAAIEDSLSDLAAKVNAIIAALD